MPYIRGSNFHNQVKCFANLSYFTEIDIEYKHNVSSFSAREVDDFFLKKMIYHKEKKPLVGSWTKNAENFEKEYLNLCPTSKEETAFLFKTNSPPHPSTLKSKETWNKDPRSLKSFIAHNWKTKNARWAQIIDSHFGLIIKNQYKFQLQKRYYPKACLFMHHQPLFFFTFHTQTIPFLVTTWA